MGDPGCCNGSTPVVTKDKGQSGIEEDPIASYIHP